MHDIEVQLVNTHELDSFTKFILPLLGVEFEEQAYLQHFGEVFGFVRLHFCLNYINTGNL